MREERQKSYLEGVNTEGTHKTKEHARR